MLFGFFNGLTANTTEGMHRIATIAHWRCACMVGLAVERHRVATLPDDGVDDANRLSVALRTQPCSICNSTKARISVRAASGAAGRVNPHACIASTKPVPLASRIWRTSSGFAGPKMFLLPQKRKGNGCLLPQPLTLPRRCAAARRSL